MKFLPLKSTAVEPRYLWLRKDDWGENPEFQSSPEYVAFWVLGEIKATIDQTTFPQLNQIWHTAKLAISPQLEAAVRKNMAQTLEAIKVKIFFNNLLGSDPDADHDFTQMVMFLVDFRNNIPEATKSFLLVYAEKNVIDHDALNEEANDFALLFNEYLMCNYQVEKVEE